METNLILSSSPHIHTRDSSRRIMLDVIIALIPAAIAGVVIFGISALWTILICVASTVLSEFLFNLCAGKKKTVGDLSAVVTGLLLALNLSTNVPLWQCALGGVFAMVVVVARHKENIGRLIKGTEPDFKPAKRKAKAQPENQ